MMGETSIMPDDTTPSIRRLLHRAWAEGQAEGHLAGIHDTEPADNPYETSDPTPLIIVNWRSGAILIGPPTYLDDGGLAVRLNDGYDVITVHDHDQRPVPGVVHIEYGTVE